MSGQLVWQGYNSKSDSVCVYKSAEGDGFKYTIVVRDIGGRIVLSTPRDTFAAAERKAINLCRVY